MEIATLQQAGQSAVSMPCWFKYTPFVPAKRIKVTQTSTGSFSQKSVPLFLYGNDYLEWEIETITRDFAEQMHQLYVLNETLTFVGVWGDSYLVEFTEFVPTPKSGLFNLKGKFRIICLISDFNPSCT